MLIGRFSFRLEIFRNLSVMALKDVWQYDGCILLIHGEKAIL